ncbi:MAG: FprA family A-type flavoprotein [Candidatus Bathyarchaeota archaeon]|nr:FprA family A-type flavoprotein [Candidatus Bathyarchaeum sp.]
MCPKILVIYDSNTGNTEKLAKAVANGAKLVCDVSVEVKRTEEVDLQKVGEADGYAIGSPSHFSIMSGKILTLLTKLYSLRNKMSGKPMAVFTTGTGAQVIALENIDRILGVFNPMFIKPGIVIETVPERANPWEIDEKQAMNLGRKLAEATIKDRRSAKICKQ